MKKSTKIGWHLVLLASSKSSASETVYLFYLSVAAAAVQTVFILLSVDFIFVFHFVRFFLYKQQSNAKKREKQKQKLTMSEVVWQWRFTTKEQRRSWQNKSTIEPFAYKWIFNVLEIFYNFSSKRKKIEKTKLLHITRQEQQPSNSVYDKVIVAAVKTKEKSWTSERERAKGPKTFFQCFCVTNSDPHRIISVEKSNVCEKFMLLFHRI